MLDLRTIGSLVVGLVCLGYTYYCLVNGGTHSRYEGWKTKEEAPKTFRFSMILYTVIGLDLCPILPIQFSYHRVVNVLRTPV